MRENKTEKKRLLFYMDTLGQGGLDKVVLDVLNHMPFDKYDVTLIRRFPGGYYSQFLDKRIKTKANMPLREETSALYNHLVRVICDKIPRKLLYKLLIHGKYDVEVACDDAFSARIIGGSTNKKSKKILWEHMDAMDNVSSATYFSKKKVRWFFDPFDEIIGVSQDCAIKFVEKYGFEDKVSYVYNPVDVDSIMKKSLEFVPEEMDKNSFNILSIGRLMPQKAFIRLIDVFSKVKQKHHNCKLFIIGEGPQEALIRAEICKHKLNGDVILLGFKENPYPYIKKADLFVCGSVHESYCLVVAESIVLEKPIVSTRCAGPIELLDNGKYGMLVENNEKGLYAGLIEMIENKEKREKYISKISERKQIFSVNECITQLEKHLETSK